MADIKLTKTELKRQRDQLKQFERFLPTLQLKKQQLQAEAARVRDAMAQHKRQEQAFLDQLGDWIGLYASADAAPILDGLALDDIRTGSQNIAGVDVPVFEDATFNRPKDKLFETPSWTEDAIEAAEQRVKLKLEGQVLSRQLELIEEELRTTTQRVNLFEKVKIPEARENIRRIQVYLGDQQTAAVCRSKIAKNKLQAKSEGEAA